VSALAQDFSYSQDFTEMTLLQRASRTTEELLRFNEAALAWLSFPLEQLKIREQMFSGKSCSKEYTRNLSEAVLVWF
jgi:hypothetical protein